MNFFYYFFAQEETFVDTGYHLNIKLYRDFKVIIYATAFLFPVVVSLALVQFCKDPCNLWIYEGVSAKPLNWVAVMLQVACTEAVAYSYMISDVLREMPLCV